MSRYDKFLMKCAVCGEVSEHVGILSTSTFGTSDLDLRPPQMQRSTIDYWLQECPYCGYVWFDISKCSEDWDSLTPGLLEREAYKTCDGIDFKSKLARKFYKNHCICMDLNDQLQAFHSLLHAAWACDDAGDTTNATLMRSMATNISYSILPSVNEIGEDEDLLSLYDIRADTLRRTNCFDSVFYEYISPYVDMLPLDKEVLDMLRFQVYLAWKRDNKVYTFTDVAQFTSRHTKGINYWFLEDGMRSLCKSNGIKQMHRFFNSIATKDYMFIKDALAKDVRYYSETNLAGAIGKHEVTQMLYTIAEKLIYTVNAVPAVVTADLESTEKKGRPCLALFYDVDSKPKQLCLIKENDDGKITDIYLAESFQYEYEIFPEMALDSSI